MLRHSPEKSLTDRVISGFKTAAKVGTAVLATLLPLNCVSGEAAWSDWPVQKTGRADERHYKRHIDDPWVRFSLRGEEERLHNYLGFTSGQVESSYRLGRQTVLRLKRTCGEENHGPDCITRSLRGIHEHDCLDDQAALVTLRERTLHYILENDETSFFDVEYDPGDREHLPRLRMRPYQIGIDGRVINPPRYSSDEITMEIRCWSDVIEIHNDLERKFNGDSIFTEDDVFEAEYFSDPAGILSRLEGLSRYLYTRFASDGAEPRPILKRASMLEDYARRYRRISDRDTEHTDEIGDAGAELIKTHRKLKEEFESGSWQNNVPQRDIPMQAVQIARYLETVRGYLNIRD